MKTYKCPECEGEVAEGYDGVWSCDFCITWFGVRPDHLDFYEEVEDGN